MKKIINNTILALINNYEYKCSTATSLAPWKWLWRTTINCRATRRAAKIMLNRPPSARPTSTNICSSNVDWTRKSQATKEFIHLMIIIFLPAREYESHARWLRTTSNTSPNRAWACALSKGQKAYSLGHCLWELKAILLYAH